MAPPGESLAGLCHGQVGKANASAVGQPPAARGREHRRSTEWRGGTAVEELLAEYLETQRRLEERIAQLRGERPGRRCDRYDENGRIRDLEWMLIDMRRSIAEIRAYLE